MTPDGVLEKIMRCLPDNARGGRPSISVEYAHRSYEQLTHARSRELKIHRVRAGRARWRGQHGVRTPDYIADWFAEQLERVA
jgi:hypothetical protein